MSKADICRASCSEIILRSFNAFCLKKILNFIKMKFDVFRVLFLSYPKFLKPNRHFIFWLSIIVTRCSSVFSSPLVTNVEIQFILISGFYRCINEIFTLLGRYAA
jgi:hypothetical protein